MLFNSLEFLIFFPVVVILFFILPGKHRWLLLLIASYYFYMAWRPEYILLIVVSTLIDYFCGLKMGSLEQKEQRWPYLWLSLLSNLGILFTFKYFNFFNESGRELTTWLGLSYHIPASELILPMGISFYTFQTMSYSIDIYNDKLKPEKHLGIFSLYVTFFPQLVAGPIERASSLLPQFRKHQKFDYDRVVSGIKLMTWGLFKKIVIADRLALLVDEVYNHPQEYHGFTLLIATVFFAFQIYCDFSGYSDIAIGGARVLGFDLMKNFQTPYFSKSISEFWRRWHISLSTWFKDYVYIPLGGNRVVKWRWYYNLFITFLISGLWHGASWTFVIWGALHGGYQIMGIVTKQWRSQLSQSIGLCRWPVLQNSLNVLVTFILVCSAWIFFRANTLHDALTVIQQMSFISTNFDSVYQELVAIGISKLDFVLSILLIGLLVLSEKWLDIEHIQIKSTGVKWSYYYLILFMLIIFGIGGNPEFIYFQF